MLPETYVTVCGRVWRISSDPDRSGPVPDDEVRFTD